MPKSPRLLTSARPWTALLASCLVLTGITTAHATAMSEYRDAESRGNYNDDRIHVYGVSPDEGVSHRVVIEAGAGLTAFGPEETMLVETADDEVIVTILDGSARLTTHGDDPFVYCRTEDGSPTNATKVRCTMYAGHTTNRTLIDFSAASVATQTATKSSGDSHKGVSYEAIEFVGGSGPDYFDGSAYADMIDGGPGDDDLFGGAGDDAVYGNTGADTVYGNAGRDTVNGGPGDDYVVGDGDLDGAPAEPDIIIGGAGVDSLDSEDNLADTRVDCENAPGLGAIEFDRRLDLPYNCPVTLAPTAPTITRISSGSSSLAVDWSPPVFDGNSDIISYEIHGRALQAGPELVRRTKGTDSSTVFANLKADVTYEFTIRAVNAVGPSRWSGPKQGVVTSGPGAPEKVTSSFATFDNATLSWQPPMVTKVEKFEVAMRVKDPRGTRWRAWETLPKGVVSATSLPVGDILRVANKRYYQFRVRSVIGNSSSDWSVSDIRYASPVQATVTKTTINPFLEMTFQLAPKQTLDANFGQVVDVTLSFATQTTTYPATSLERVGSTYVASFRASVPENSACNLAITYTVQGSASDYTMTTSSPCRFPQ